MKTVKNYVYSSLYQLFLIIVPFATIPYVSRVLGAELIGVNSFTNTIMTYFVLFANLGTTVYGNRTIAYYRESKIGCFISYLPHILSFYLVIP